jgi:hypothetical protein
MDMSHCCHIAGPDQIIPLLDRKSDHSRPKGNGTQHRGQLLLTPIPLFRIGDTIAMRQPTSITISMLYQMELLSVHHVTTDENGKSLQPMDATTVDGGTLPRHHSAS